MAKIVNKWDLRTEKGKGKYLSYLKSCWNDEERKRGLMKLINLYAEKENWLMVGYCYENLGNFNLASKYYARSAVQKIYTGRIKKDLYEILQIISVALNHPEGIERKSADYIETFLENNIANETCSSLYRKMKRKYRKW